MRTEDIKGSNDAYSPFKAAMHKGDLAILKHNGIIPPKCIQVDLEGYCPHDCSFCAYRNAAWNTKGQSFFNADWAEGLEGNKDLKQTGSPKGKRVEGVSGFPRDVAMELPLQMIEARIPSIELTGGGEPTSYPFFDEFIDALAEYPRLEVALVTNGQLLTKKRFDILNNQLQWLRFSVDSASPETHALVHGVPKTVFPQVIKNIQYAIDNKTPQNKVGISFIVNPSNYYDIITATSMFKAMGADNIRFSFVYDVDGKGRLSDNEKKTIDEFIRLAGEEENNDFKVFGSSNRIDNYSKPNTDFTFCGYQHFTWAIGYDCLVYPCCVMKYNKPYAFGDLRKDSLNEIIFSDKREKIS